MTKFQAGFLILMDHFNCTLLGIPQRRPILRLDNLNLFSSMRVKFSCFELIDRQLITSVMKKNNVNNYSMRPSVVAVVNSRLTRITAEPAKKHGVLRVLQIGHLACTGTRVGSQ